MASSSSSSSYLLSLLVLTISLTQNPSFFAEGDTDLIQRTCKTTKFYDLCLTSLKSDSTSPKADTKGLAIIMVKIAMANATATNSYLSAQLLNKTISDNLTKKVLKECAGKYSLASNALQVSVQDLDAEVYDYAYMHVMAAADYANACRNAFKRYLSLVYPPEVAAREDGLKRICDVVMGIIDSIGF